MSTPEMAATRVDEVVDGIYRISTFVPEFELGFNQFLIDDERPALLHTGDFQMYDGVRGAISEVLDPSRLAYVALLHFESDECGGMDRFAAGAPESTLIGSAMSIGLNLAGWDYQGKVQGFADGEVLDLGRHKLRFLETPHVHHWDSMMIFEETTRSVFPADLYMQPGGSSLRWSSRTSPAPCSSSTASPGSLPTSNRCERSSTGSRPSTRTGCTPCTAARSPARSCRATRRRSASS